MIQKTRIAIALGSNLGNRLEIFKKAVLLLLSDFLEDAQSSSVYETKPWGITEQPPFLNAVVTGFSEWKPPAIVGYLKGIEKDLGRTSTIKNGPRLIDLDLLIWGENSWESEGVIVPHPGMAERDFVLIPLVEVWPDWFHQGEQKTVAQLTEAVLKKTPLSAKFYAPRLLDTKNL